MPHPLRFCLVLLFSLSLQLSSADTPGKAPMTPTPDAALMSTDEAFCRDALRLGIVEAFMEYAAEDAIFFDVDPRDARGKEVLEGRRKAWASMRRLHWQPLGAEVAASGDLGYTWGESLAEITGKDGTVQNFKGLYVSIWRKSKDGRWRYVLDTGSDAPARKTKKEGDTGTGKP